MKHLILLLLIVPVLGFSQNMDFKKQRKGFGNKLGADDYSFEVGSSVGTMFNNSWYLNNYFTPSVSFDINKKLSLVAGIGTSFSQYNNVPLINSEYQFENSDLRLTSFFAYASGIYKLNNKMNVYSTILVEDANYNFTDNAQQISKQYKDVSIGVNYNITPKVTINAEFNFSDRPYSRYYNSNSMQFGGNSLFYPGGF